LIVTHLGNARLFLAPTPYLSLNAWCLARVRPRSATQALLAFSLSAPVTEAALAAAGSVKATARAAPTASKAVRIGTCRLTGTRTADDVRIWNMWPSRYLPR
jgi:hypothetical protein